MYHRRISDLIKKYFNSITGEPGRRQLLHYYKLLRVVIGAAALILLFIGWKKASKTAPAEKPNIIFILTDDMGLATSPALEEHLYLRRI
jgi:hypothetical protein